MKTIQLSESLVNDIVHALNIIPNKTIGVRDNGKTTYDLAAALGEELKNQPQEEGTRITVKITDEQRENLLVSALEGGSNYWYCLRTDAEKEITKFVPEFPTLRKETPYVELMWKAIQAGAVIPVRDVENPKDVLGHISLASIAEGEQFMADNHSRHFTAIIDENDDAETGDVWFQLATLRNKDGKPEIVYG